MSPAKSTGPLLQRRSLKCFFSLSGSAKHVAVCKTPWQSQSTEKNHTGITQKVDYNAITKLQQTEVSEYEQFIASIAKHFRFKANDFEGGQISHFPDEWKALHSDEEFPKMVSGHEIEFVLTAVQIIPPFQPN